MDAIEKFKEACRELEDAYVRGEWDEHDLYRQFPQQVLQTLHKSPQIALKVLYELQHSLDEVRDANRRAREALETETKALATEKERISVGGILEKIKDYVRSPQAWSHDSAFDTAMTVDDIITYYEQRIANGDDS